MSGRRAGGAGGGDRYRGRSRSGGGSYRSGDDGYYRGGGDNDGYYRGGGDDDGYYRADSGQLSAWPNNRQVDIFLYSVVESSGILPWNNASSRVVGASGVYGAGFIDN